MMDIGEDIPRGSELVKSSRKLARMQNRENRIPYLLYPEDKILNIWEIIVSFSLLAMCVATPLYIAFHDE